MTKTQNWKAFGGKYLLAENVANNTDQYVITKVDSEDENGRETLIFTVERNGVSKLFGCNVTNEQAVKSVCPDSPEQALSRVITFNKVQVTNPNTKQIVDGLRLVFIPEVLPVTQIGQVPIPVDSGISADGTM